MVFFFSGLYPPFIQVFVRLTMFICFGFPFFHFFSILLGLFGLEINSSSRTKNLLGALFYFQF